MYALCVDGSRHLIKVKLTSFLHSLMSESNIHVKLKQPCTCFFLDIFLVQLFTIN